MHLKAMLPAEAAAFFVSLGENSYRGRQALKWLYGRGARTWSSMTDFPAGLRERLEATHPLLVLETASTACSADGTVKALLRAGDGTAVEAVGLPRERFFTVCVSSQAGCALQCSFCLTGRRGFQRNLDASEIVDQVLLMAGVAGRAAPTHVVFMGMGEPLLNLDNVERAVRVITAEGALGLSPSRVTVSTAGLPEKMRAFGKLGLRTGVALSLNATDDPTRAALMPVAGRSPLKDVLDAFRSIPATRRNPRTIEYAMMAGVNDSRAQAGDLARIARSVQAKVNLIPFNESEGMPFRAPSEGVIEAFLSVLSSAGVTATVRRSLGLDIRAACGQLAGEAE